MDLLKFLAAWQEHGYVDSFRKDAGGREPRGVCMFPTLPDMHTAKQLEYKVE